jgi:hypothetical protein
MQFIIFNDSSLFKRRASGAYRLATLFRQRGYSVKVIDYTTIWTHKDLFQVLDKITSDTIGFGFSYTWMNSEETRLLIDALKERYPNKKYFAGGQKPFQQEVGFDVMVSGYAENFIDKLLDYLVNNKPVVSKKVFGLKGIHINANTDYPATNIDDLSTQYSHDDFLERHEVLTVELSRGCRFKCKFCSYPFLGFKHSTYRSKDNLKKEFIENYKKFGITSYTIADDTVNDDDAKLEMLASVVEELPFEIDFAAFVRMDLVVTRPYQMELLKRCRIWAHFYGIETFHPVAGKAIGKGMNSDRIKQGLLDMRKYFLDNLGLYRGSCGLIAGLPGEPVSSWHETQQWMKENWSTEAWHWWPLDITDDKYNHIIQSEFALNKEKYGYEKITSNSRINDFLDWAEDMKYMVHHQVDENFFYWKSNETDFFEAFEFVHKINTSNAKCNRLPNFYVLSFKHLVDNKKDVLDLPYTAEAKYQITKPMQKYKIKMLNFYKNA